MRIERLLVPVLLVDDDGVRFTIDCVRDVRNAARFLAGFMGQRRQQFVDALPIIAAKSHANCKADHSRRVAHSLLSSRTISL